MKGVTVLVIEDNAANMMLATSVLKLSGYTPFQAMTAEEGIALAKAEAPDLILMDISLPGMDGLEATVILKEDSRTRNIPVVALTAHAMKGDEERCLAAGCVGYIAKPFRIKTFSDAVARFMSAVGAP